MDNIVFRKLNENDEDLFITLRMAYIMETFDCINESDIEQLKISLKLFFIEHINKNDFFGMISENNEEIISAAYLIFMDFIPNPGIKEGKTGTLLNVYTFPEYRKKGFAKKLLNEVIKEAKLLGIKSIALKSTDDGYILYKDLGFVDDNMYKNMVLGL